MENLRVENVSSAEHSSRQMTPEERWPGIMEDLRRPLDEADLSWMQSFGANIPEDPQERTVWFEHANKLVIVGGEKMSSKSDDYKHIVYRSRTEFCELFPALEVAQSRYDRSVAIRNRIIPSQAISAARFLQSYLKQDVDDITHYFLHNHLMATLPQGTIISSANYLLNQGVSPQGIAQYYSLFARSKRSLQDLNRTLRAFARVANIDPKLLTSEAVFYANGSRQTQRILARMLLTQFRRRTVVDWAPSVRDSHVLLWLPIESTVSVHLERGGVISTVGGLAYQSRLLHKHYAKEELRGYLQSSFCDNPDNQLLQTYFKAYPLEEGEAEQLPMLKALPIIHYDQPSAPTYITSSEALSLKRVSSTSNLKWIVAEIEKADDSLQCQLFRQVHEGLLNEMNMRDYYDDWNADIDAGREARKQLVLMYASDAIALIPHDRRNSEDAIQRQLLALLVVVMDFVENNRAIDVEAFWPYAKRFLKTAKNKDLYGDEWSESDDDGIYT